MGSTRVCTHKTVLRRNSALGLGTYVRIRTYQWSHASWYGRNTRGSQCICVLFFNVTLVRTRVPFRVLVTQQNRTYVRTLTAPTTFPVAPHLSACVSVFLVVFEIMLCCTDTCTYYMVVRTHVRTVCVPKRPRGTRTIKRRVVRRLLSDDAVPERTYRPRVPRQLRH